jgi:hypothetical protein
MDRVPIPPLRRKVSRPMAQKRELFRVVLERTGQIQRGNEVVPCKLIDLTEKGFKFESEGSFHLGEDIHLEFNLSESAPILCTVRVTHVQPPYLGARIIRIAPDHQTRLSHFIDQLNALNMTGF